jgi:pimeloyl-ACP methyl ester carboxylesterase
VPGAEALVALASSRPALSGLGWSADHLRRGGARGATYLRAAARALGELDDPGSRRAFLGTLRSVISARGQRVNARDRLYLLGAMPTLVVWGGRDGTIPVEHGHAAHAKIPGSSLAILPRAAHFPHLEDPDGLAAALRHFLATTSPARLDAAAWRELLEEGIRRQAGEGPADVAQPVEAIRSASG